LETSRKKTAVKVHLTLIFVQFAFGTFHVVGKSLLDTMHPLALAGVRALFAAPLLFVIARRVDRVWPQRKDLPRLALLGMLGVFLNQVLFVLGLNFTTATNAAILMPSIPVFAAVAAGILGVERLGLHRLVGVGAAVAGALVMLDVFGFSMAGGAAFGNLLILVNCASFALFLVLQRPILKRLPPLTVIAWAYVFGGSAVVLVSFREVAAFAASLPDFWTVAGLAYIVLIPTTLAYALNTWAISRSSSTLAATYTTLQPLATATLAAIFLAETVGWREATGFVLIVTGLMFVSRPRDVQKG